MDYKIYEKYRDKKGLNDTKVAELSCVCQQAISRWKVKHRSPKIESLKEIAKVLDIPMLELIK